MIEYQWYYFDELTLDLLHEILWLRQDVFVIEQKCPYDDIDGRDKHSWHLIGRDDSGEMVAYLRLVKPGYKFDDPSIGRILTAQKVRGTGVGLEMMEVAIKKAEELVPGSAIMLSAQQYAKDFYAKFGFTPVGEPYDDAGIMHINMIRPYRYEE